MQEEGDKLFSKYVNVLLKDYDQKTISLNISVYSRGHTATTGCKRRELYVRLTTPDDLLFLQTLTLSEDDFQCLKQQQGLLVDYAAFPQKFIDLLELCITDQRETTPRFVLHLTTGSLTTTHGTLEVVETNPFKHLVHLSLRFVPGNDEEVKHYLATCLKAIKDEKEAIHKQLVTTETKLSAQLTHAQSSLKESIEEMEGLKIQWQEKLGKVKEKHETELMKEKDTLKVCRQQFEERLQEEHRDHNERYNTVVGDLETKLNAMLAGNKSLTDTKYQYEALIRDLKSQLATLEEERQVKSKDHDMLRLQNHHLDNDRHERDKTLNHLKTRLAVLEQEVKNKEQVISQSNQIQTSTNEQKNRLESELERKNHVISQLEANVQSVSSEVVKGNEIIQKLQLEIKTLKSKVKMMMVVSTKQEKLIEEKDLSLGHLTTEKKSNEEKIKQLQEKISQYDVTAEESAQKITEHEEKLKNNENVINWLNKQLNEHTMTRLSQNNNTSVRHNGSHGNIHNGSGNHSNRVSNRVPLGDKTSSVSNNNILPPNRHSTFNNGNLGNDPIKKDYLGLNNIRNSVANKPTPRMPYDGNMFGKPRFQNENDVENISPIVAQSGGHGNILREKQQQQQQQQHSSTPVVDEPVVDAKYLMRRRTDRSSDNETPISVTKGNEENILPASLHALKVTSPTLTAAKPYPLPSSYFP